MLLYINPTPGASIKIEKEISIYSRSHLNNNIKHHDYVSCSLCFFLLLSNRIRKTETEKCWITRDSSENEVLKRVALFCKNNNNNNNRIVLNWLYLYPTILNILIVIIMANYSFYNMVILSSAKFRFQLW